MDENTFTNGQADQNGAFNQNPQPDPNQQFGQQPYQGQQYQQPQYQQPAYTAPNPYAEPDYKNNPNYMKLTDWIVTWLLMCIPIANIILMFVWAFGKPSEPKFQSRKTMMQAYLLVYAIVLAIVIVISLVAGISLASFFSSFGDY